MRDRFAAACPSTFNIKPRPIAPDQVDDNKPLTSDTQAMNEITREELDAKLDATNAKLEARLSSFEGLIRETLAAVRQDSAEMRGELKVMHSELSGLKNIKGSIWGAAGATIIGVGGILAAILSYGNSNYDTARENTTVLAEAKAQIVQSSQKVDDSLKAMSSQLEESKRQSAETQKLLEQVKAHQNTKTQNSKS